MTVSDREFIIRIQVSQIVSVDPLADDYYNNAIVTRRQHAQQAMADRARSSATKQPASATPSTKIQPNKKALERMHAQVGRIVDATKERDRRKEIYQQSDASQRSIQHRNNLQGALGKVTSKGFKAPRQTLQVASSSNSPATASLSQSDVSAALLNSLNSSTQVSGTDLCCGSLMLNVCRSKIIKLHCHIATHWPSLKGFMTISRSLKSAASSRARETLFLWITI